MLPPGHIAGGYLVSKAVLNLIPYSLSADQSTTLLYWGVFFAFAPDMDTFYSFLRSKSFTLKNKAANHRLYFTHTPLVWFFVGIIIFLLAQSPYYKAFGILVWLASWSHFLLDSIQYGIMWLWPFSTKLYRMFALNNSETNETLMSEISYKKIGFFEFWMRFLQIYLKAVRISLMLEILIIIVAIIYA